MNSRSPGLKPPPQKTPAGRALHGFLVWNINAALARKGINQVQLGKLLTGGDDETAAGARRVRRTLAGAWPDADGLAEFATALGFDEPFELLQPPPKRAKAHEPTE